MELNQVPKVPSAGIHYKLTTTYLMQSFTSQVPLESSTILQVVIVRHKDRIGIASMVAVASEVVQRAEHIVMQVLVRHHTQEAQAMEASFLDMRKQAAKVHTDHTQVDLASCMGLAAAAR